LVLKIGVQSLQCSGGISPQLIPVFVAHAVEQCVDQS
jgi:hypothetical protein